MTIESLSPIRPLSPLVALTQSMGDMSVPETSTSCGGEMAMMIMDDVESCAGILIGLGNSSGGVSKLNRPARERSVSASSLLRHSSSNSLTRRSHPYQQPYKSTHPLSSSLDLGIEYKSNSISLLRNSISSTLISCSSSTSVVPPSPPSTLPISLEDDADDENDNEYDDILSDDSQDSVSSNSSSSTISSSADSSCAISSPPSSYVPARSTRMLYKSKKQSKTIPIVPDLTNGRSNRHHHHNHHNNNHHNNNSDSINGIDDIGLLTSTTTTTTCIFSTPCMLCKRGRPDILVRTPTWASIMKVVFYTLSFSTPSKPFYSLRSDVYSFVETHWDVLTKNKKKTSNWHKQIQDMLSHSKSMFESGAEFHGQNGFWNLKYSVDPWAEESPITSQQSSPTLPTQQSSSILSLSSNNVVNNPNYLPFNYNLNRTSPINIVPSSSIRQLKPLLPSQRY